MTDEEATRLVAEVRALSRIPMHPIGEARSEFISFTDINNWKATLRVSEIEHWQIEPVDGSFQLVTNRIDNESVTPQRVILRLRSKGFGWNLIDDEAERVLAELEKLLCP